MPENEDVLDDDELKYMTGQEVTLRYPLAKDLRAKTQCAYTNQQWESVGFFAQEGLSVLEQNPQDISDDERAALKTFFQFMALRSASIALCSERGFEPTRFAQIVLSVLAPYAGVLSKTDKALHAIIGKAADPQLLKRYRKFYKDVLEAAGRHLSPDQGSSSPSEEPR